MLSNQPEKHPLLLELLKVCNDHNVEVKKAHTTFEVYTELSQVRKLFDVEYGFNEKLKMFYLLGKEKGTEVADVYVPILYSETITMEEVELIQENICPLQNRFYLIIRDSDSSSTCYTITKGLVKPDSPETCKEKKDMESQKYFQEKKIESNKKILYTQALKKTS